MHPDNHYRSLSLTTNFLKTAAGGPRRGGALPDQRRLPAGGQRGPVPGVPRDGSPVRVHHHLRRRLPPRPPLCPPQQLGRDQA